MVLVIAGSAAILWAPQPNKLWKTNFDGLTFFELIFYSLFLIGLFNGIFYAVRLVTWGRTIHEELVTSTLPVASSSEISVLPSVPLRIMIFFRSKHTLSDVTGTVKILSSSPRVVVAEKKIVGKQGTKAKVAILSVAREQNSGRIVVETALERKSTILNRDDGRDLVFDIIVRAKL
jgi:hypothetical protein